MLSPYTESKRNIRRYMPEQKFSNVELENIRICFQVKMAAQNNKKDRNLKYFVTDEDNNRHWDTSTLREGKALTDAYSKRSLKLIDKAKEIERITGCKVYLKILPGDWQNGKTHSYTSPDFEVTQVSASREKASQPQDVVRNTPPHRTPQKKLARTPGAASSSSETFRKKDKASKKKQKYDSKRCHICKVEWGTDEDDELGFLWLQCGAARCSFWVHGQCSNIFYHDNRSGSDKAEAWAKNHFFCPLHMPKNETSEESGDQSEEEIQKGKGKYIRKCINSKVGEKNKKK